METRKHGAARAACAGENKKLDGGGGCGEEARARYREFCRVFCRVIRTPSHPPSPTKGVNYQAVLGRRKGARERGGGGERRGGRQP